MIYSTKIGLEKKRKMFHLEIHWQYFVISRVTFATKSDWHCVLYRYEATQRTVWYLFNVSGASDAGAGGEGRRTCRSLSVQSVPRHHHSRPLASGPSLVIVIVSVCSDVSVCVCVCHVSWWWWWRWVLVCVSISWDPKIKVSARFIFFIPIMYTTCCY